MSESNKKSMKLKVKKNCYTHESLQDTLSFFGVNCHRPYYISSGNPIFEYPSNAFRIDFYAICICTAGDITIEIDNQEYHFSKNRILVSAPTTIIKFSQVSANFRMKLIFFDKAFLLKHIVNPFFIEQLGFFKNSTFTIVSAKDNLIDKLINLIDYLKEVSLRTTHFTADIIRTVIFNLLLEIADELASKDQDPMESVQETNNLFYKFTDLVQRHSNQYKDVQYYADQLFISNKYLIQVVKRASGKTPHEIIDEHVLKEAYVLLGNPEKTISEISYEIGFNSISAFGRFFKKYATLSPSEYRKRQNM
ncbi:MULTISPECIES: helix-turn-helix domain-containing protein [unclassified Sphingobacterium]|uniref:helix-turn-helix domain-containing protein n=1 Tax=unclassified Sphingobacterium TaxID=2609468 RepID=UPI0025FFEDDA|nr:MULTISPECIES: helix-turn-helix domain-containing protein [unclassified Sphingobacterium]